jgi:hypothetical protein
MVAAACEWMDGGRCDDDGDEFGHAARHGWLWTPRGDGWRMSGNNEVIIGGREGLGVGEWWFGWEFAVRWGGTRLDRRVGGV